METSAQTPGQSAAAEPALASTPAPSGDLSAGLLELLGELVHEMQPDLSPDDMTWESRLDRDLGLDSVSRVELLMRLEQRFDVRVREEELAVAETPTDLLNLIRQSNRGSVWKVEPLIETPPLEPAGGSLATPSKASTLVEVLEWYVDRQPGRRHLTLYGDHDQLESLTYGQLFDSSLEVAAGLRAQGLIPGQPVAIMLPTSFDYFYVFYGALLAGLVPVPLYPPVRPSQLEDHLRRQVRILDNCQAPVLVTVPEARTAARLLKSQVDTMRWVVTLEELRTASAGTPKVVHHGAGTDLAFLQYTSGSTGQPRGVALSHDNLLTNLRAMLRSVEAGSEDTFVSWLPLYHDMGLIGAGMGSLYASFSLVLMSPLTFLSRPSRWLRAISDHHGTISGGPNFAYELCLSKIPEADLEGLDLSSWRLAFNGAEPVLPETLRRFAERFEPFGLRPEAMHPVYGLAESSLGIAFPPPGRLARIDRIKRRGYVSDGVARPAREPESEKDPEQSMSFVGCGFPLPGHQIRIADERGHELPERAVGHVQFRGPSSTRGYYRNPEATRRLFVGEWLDSGDLGYMAGGELFLTGRSKDLIIKAGRNLSPEEIEETVGEVEGVRKGCVAAFGFTDEETGTDRLVVLAETRVEDRARRERMRREIFGVTTDVVGIAPDDVVLAPPGTVLKTSSGKIRRSASRELYQKGQVSKARPGVARQFLNLGLSSVWPLLRRVRRSAGAVFYTIYSWLLLALIVGTLGLVVLILPGERRRQLLTRFAARSLLALAGIPRRVEGLEHLPENESFIVALNHASYVDAVVVAAELLPGVRIAAKRELGLLAPVGWILRRIGVDLVERFDREQGVEDARAMLEKLRGGSSMAAFPEGTFTRIPGLLPFRMGTFVNAVDGGVPVVPAVLRGTRSLLRANEWLLRRGPVSLRLFPAVRPRGQGWHAAVELRNAVRQQILDHCGEPDLADEREEGLEKLRQEREARRGAAPRGP